MTNSFIEGQQTSNTWRDLFQGAFLDIYILEETFSVSDEGWCFPTSREI